MEGRSALLESLVACQVWYAGHKATFWLLWLGGLPVALAALRLFGPFEFAWAVLLFPLVIGLGFVVGSMPLAILQWRTRSSKPS